MNCELLFEQYHDELLRFIKARTRNDADAEDICSQVFIELVRRADTLANEHPRAWLYAVAKSRIVDWQRAKARKPAENIDDHTVVADGDIEDSVIEQQSLGEIQSRVGQLPPRQRKAVQLRYIEGLSIEEAAARMGLSYGALKALTRRARTNLLKHVEEKQVVTPSVTRCSPEQEKQNVTPAFEQSSVDTSSELLRRAHTDGYALGYMEGCLAGYRARDREYMTGQLIARRSLAAESERVMREDFKRWWREFRDGK